jgi:signal transduction histidine kinase
VEHHAAGRDGLEGHPLSRIGGWVDAAVSKALRYDLSRQDVLTWFRFARNLFLLLLASVVTIAGLAGVMATRQAGGLLEASLAAQGRAIAVAAARAAFVPLSLDDDAALGVLAKSYAGTPDLAYLRILNGRRSRRAESTFLATEPGRPLLDLEVPVVAPVSGRRVAAAAGFVEVGMSTAAIRARSRRIALVNLAGSVALAVLVLVAAALLLRQAVERMREVVGEARLAHALQVANGELEAFSYSVSHDLRAPLRAVDGFSQILLEDYATVLDETGRGHLDRIRAGCQRMGQLIDDLLKLSRVIRQVMRREDVDLGATAAGVMEQLRAGDPGRHVTFIGPARLVVRGDPGLLRSALENLVGNAWKFTSKRPDARIEFGSRQENGETVYFVADNGAGFDNAYAGKLFGAFQRLHAQTDFEGTGIGLATVHRIIARHGGRIWAHGEVGKGATISFTLGGEGAGSART